MKLSDGVEWGLHACVVLAVVPPDRALPAAKLAELHELPATYLAKHLQALAGAGIVESVPGRRGGYRLARPSDDITVLDIVLAVEGRAPAFRCTEIRKQGPAADPEHSAKAPCSIAAVMAGAEAAWRASLASVTLTDLLVRTGAAISPVTIRKSAEFLQEAIR